MGKLGRLPIVLLLAANALGCGSGVTVHDQPVRFMTETLPGGLVQVTNSGVPAWTPETAWRLVEDLRLGTAEGGGPEQFAFIAAALADSLGMIYILEALSQTVRVFHPDGRFSHSFGGSGRGPGEFVAASHLSFGPGDTIWVHDPDVGRRYSAFDCAGNLLTSHRRTVLGPPIVARHGPDGRFIDWGMAFPDEGPNVVAGARRVAHPIRLGPDFEVADSLPPLEFQAEMITTEIGSFPQVYFSENLVAFQDIEASIWFARTREYRIFRRDLEGDTTLVFTLPAEPAPVTPADHDEIRANYRARPDLLQAYLDALPRTKPVIRRIVGDDAGHIYVVPELAGVPAGTALDVFRDTGEYLGRLPLPVPIHITRPVIFATRDHLYYVVADEFDLPYLARFRIER